MITVKQQAERFMQMKQASKRSPIKPKTYQTYQSHLNGCILPKLGKVDLADVKNGLVKDFVSDLAKQLKPASIVSVYGLLKQIVESATDADGNQLYTQKWNTDFIDLPKIDQSSQRAPIISQQQLEQALGKAQETDRCLYRLLAGTGLRIGESLALTTGTDDGKNSFWNRETGIITVRSTVVDGEIQMTPKTESSNREIDICPELNQVLSASLPEDGLLFSRPDGLPCWHTTMLRTLQENGIETGFHAFRRFRITHMEKQGVPRALQMFWTGHAAQSVHETYIKIGSDMEARKNWAKKAGLGFDCRTK